MIPVLLLCLAPGDAGSEFFEKKVRPVLVQHCFKCHSAAGKKRGGLHLDSRSALLKGGDLGPAIVPGDPEKSRLIEAVRYKNVEMQMPPGSKLPDAAIADLTAWVKMGAPWPGGGTTAAAEEKFDLARRKATHWAWKALTDPPVPAVRDAAWPRTTADRFLLAGLEKAKLAPAPDADRHTLARRLYFDLIGLPPTVEELQAFVHDRRPDAVERLVDRLLASPRFGEKWARHWLDLVRYAETRGHEFDFNIPNAHEYRDYVIRALNAGVPYDRFVREQVAGDLLAEPRLTPDGANESVLGTGLYFLGEEVHSPVDIRADQADRFDNRIDVLSKTFLGLTVSCARCHDHKFDAISTKDYYALYGFLSSSNYRQVRFDGWKTNRDVAARLAAVRAEARAEARKEIARQALPTISDLAKHLAANKDWAPRGPDSPFHQWDAPAPKVPAGSATPAVDEWLPDDVTFTARRAGDLFLAGAEVGVAERSATHLDPFWARARSTGETEPGALAGARAGRTVRSPSFQLTTGRVHVLVRGALTLYASVGSHVMLAGPLHGRLVQRHGPSKDFRWVGIDLRPYAGQHVHLELTAGSDDFAVARVVQGDAPPLTPARPRLARALALPVAQRPKAMQKLFLDVIEADKHDEETAWLLAWVLRNPKRFGIDLAAVAAKWQEAEAALAKEAVFTSRLAPAMQDGTGVDENVFIRGMPHSRGEPAPRRFLTALVGDRPLSLAKGSGRLELARQMTDPATTPLVPRVMVNRLWHHLFGRGIVASVDDFGVMGQAPTHPELLDHLATRFVRDGWSVKAMVRELVSSRAYRMSSNPSPHDAADPENHRWHRAQLRRLTGEAIRDSLLALSGQLRQEMFGKPVLTYLTEFQDGRGRPASGPLDGAGRRSVYLGVRRNFLSSFLLAFDTPAPFSTVGRRTVSNVPAQSLILMNDSFVQQQSGLWAKRALASPGDAAARVRRMYLAAFARPASAAEVSACLELLSGRKDEAAWADLAHALVNVKELVFLR